MKKQTLTFESSEPMLDAINERPEQVALAALSFGERQEMLALLTILALSSREIEQGQFRSASQFFAEHAKEDA